MKKQIFSFFILLSALASYAQCPPLEIIYGGTGFDNARSVIQTVDSGYAITGSSTSFGDGSTDIFVLKADKHGNVEWLKDFGGTNIDRAGSIRQTADNGFIIAGYTNSFGLGTYSAYVIRTNSTGDTLWTRIIGGTDWSFATHAEPTSDGGFIISGNTYNTSNENENAWLFKLDSSGNQVWSNNYGGANDETAGAARQCVNGDYILVGTTNSFGAGKEDMYLVRTNSSGDTLWTKTYGDTSNDEGRFVEETMDGGLIICGSSVNPDSLHKDFHLIKTDANGTPQWNYQYFGVTADDEPYEIHQATDGGYACLGYSMSYGGGKKDYMLLRTESNGAFIYGYTFGSIADDVGYSMNTTFNHGFVLVGETESYGAMPVNIYLIITDSTGNASNNILYGIKENSIAAFSSDIYPNPCDRFGYLSIRPKNSEEKITGYSIFSLEGKKVFESTELIYEDKTVKLPVEVLQDGMYIVSISSSSGIVNKKLSVIHK